MKRFIKGKLETVVEDNDRRIPEYLANGWKEAGVTPKPKDAADEQTDKALGEVNASEGKGRGKKHVAPDEKVNAAIKANSAAAVEGEEIDDGLLKKEGK